MNNEKHSTTIPFLEGSKTNIHNIKIINNIKEEIEFYMHLIE